MNRDEVVNTLLDRASIEPGFTNFVWQKLEEENAEFFKAYHIRLKLKNQIDMYNQLLEQQYHLMKEQVPTNVGIAPVQNGMHRMAGAVNNLPKLIPWIPYLVVMGLMEYLLQKISFICNKIVQKKYLLDTLGFSNSGTRLSSF